MLLRTSSSLVYTRIGSAAVSARAPAPALEAGDGRGAPASARERARARALDPPSASGAGGEAFCVRNRSWMNSQFFSPAPSALPKVHKLLSCQNENRTLDWLSTRLCCCMCPRAYPGMP